MKTRNIIIIALGALLTAACHSWDAPAEGAGMENYGNQHIEESNLITIAQLKSMIPTPKLSDNKDSLKLIEKPTQIRGVVTANDEGGNIYQSLYIQDETGGIAISISQGGLYGAFAVGQCVLIEMKGLYVGSYGKQPQIGTVYINPNKENAYPSVGRMSRDLWAEHYKLIPAVEGLSAEPIQARNMYKFTLDNDCGRLITLRNVSLEGADGTAVFAPEDGSVSLTSNCANRNLNEIGNVVIRTSTYAKFAKTVMPKGKVDITGVATRYNDTWQILMRTLDDIKPTTVDSSKDPVITPEGDGTETAPYNVAKTLDVVNAMPADGQSEDIYIKGVIVNIVSIGTNDNYGNATYYIADEPEAINGVFYIYRGFGLQGQKFNEGNAKIIKVGDEVILKTKVTNYKGKTPETVANTCSIVSLNGQTEVDKEEIGTADNPITVANAIEYISGLKNGGSSSGDAYVKGIISNVQSFNDKYKSITYYISDNGQTDNQLQVYSGKGLNGADFSALTDLEVGKTVIVKGKLKKYVNNNTGAVTNEIDQSSEIISIQ